ncbi:unnamed protein product, partial [Brachionus calyciflorus]
KSKIKQKYEQSLAKGIEKVNRLITERNAEKNDSTSSNSPPSHDILNPKNTVDKNNAFNNQTQNSNYHKGNNQHPNYNYRSRSRSNINSKQTPKFNSNYINHNKKPFNTNYYHTSYNYHSNSSNLSKEKLNNYNSDKSTNKYNSTKRKIYQIRKIQNFNKSPITNKTLRFENNPDFNINKSYDRIFLIGN